MTLLRETQDLLARLYVDPALLSGFLTDRASFVSRHGGLADAVAEIDGEQLEFFARSLIRKRANEVRKLLPMTSCALDGEFDEQFIRFAATSVPSGHKKHAADALAFSRYLTEGPAGLGTPRSPRGKSRALSKANLAGEAARFELLRLSMRLRLVRNRANPSVIRVALRRWPWIRLARFSAELTTLIEGGDRARRAEKRSERLTVLFISFWGFGGVWYWT